MCEEQCRYDSFSSALLQGKHCTRKAFLKEKTSEKAFLNTKLTLEKPYTETNEKASYGVWWNVSRMRTMTMHRLLSHSVLLINLLVPLCIHEWHVISPHALLHVHND